MFEDNVTPSIASRELRGTCWDISVDSCTIHYNLARQWTYFDDETLNMFKDNHFAFPFSAQQLSTFEMM